MTNLQVMSDQVYNQSIIEPVYGLAAAQQCTTKGVVSP